MAYDDRFRQVGRYAVAHGFFAGFPNFEEANYGDGVVRGTIFLRATEADWRDIPRTDYGGHDVSEIPALFRAAQTIAANLNYPAAFPTFEQQDHGQGVVFGTILLKPGMTDWRDVLRSDLGNPDINDVPAMMRAASRYASANGYSAGFPTFNQANYGAGVVYGIVLLKPGVSTWRDVPADLLAQYTARVPRWVIIVSGCSDMPATPTTVAKAAGFFTESGAGAQTAYDYFRDMSVGTAGLRDTTVFFVPSIQHTIAELTAIGGGAQRRQAFDWGVAAAKALGIPVDNYDHKVVFLNGGGTDHGSVGVGVTFVFADATALEPTFIFHECGHEFGLDHSFSESATPCAGGDARAGAYCDTTDIMSAMNVNSFIDAAGRVSGPSLNAASRQRLGWLHHSRVRDVSALSVGQTIALTAINHSDVDGIQMLTFIGPSRDNPANRSTYTIEFREPSGWDAGIGAAEILIHEIRPDGLVRMLSNAPPGILALDQEFVSPDRLVVRANDLDTTNHVATLQISRLNSTGTRELRIVDINFHPASPEAQGEFVILENDRANAVDLTGWTLRDLSRHIFVFPSFTLKPGHVVKVWTGLGTNDAENLFWGRQAPVWNDGGDTASLRDPAGTQIAVFSY